MKSAISVLIVTGACLLGGCGKSPSTPSESAQNPTAAPASTAPTAPPAPAAAPAPVSPAPSPLTASTAPTPPPTTPATAPAENSTPAATSAPPSPDNVAPAGDPIAGPVAQFASAAAGQADKQAASIGADLAAKAKTLAQSAGGNPELKTQLGGALQSLSAGKDASALGTLFQQVKQANLTPQQTQLAKDVGNLASAYVVQRNFSSLDGAQGDVATIVNSLRQGTITPALPALQSLGQNASLTPRQKDLIATLAEQYAPGLKKASDSLSKGLQSLQGLTK